MSGASPGWPTKPLIPEAVLVRGARPLKAQ